MHDVDFGKLYREKRTSSLRAENQVRISGLKKLWTPVAIALIAFTLGMFFGRHSENARLTASIEQASTEEPELANIAPQQRNPAAVASPGEVIEASRPDDVPASAEPSADPATYLILARIFPEEKSAYSAGLHLKKAGFDAFLAKNGNKYKIYVGPIKGKNPAYETLARIKNLPEYKGAILYKK